MRLATGVAEGELASAIDNPMVMPDGRVESGGNFHGAPLGLACDLLSIAAAEVGAIAAHRIDRLLDPDRSRNLPPFLSNDPGVNSGLMIAHYTQAAMVAENRRPSAPASADTLATSATQEDHVSLGWGAARKLRVSLANLRPDPGRRGHHRRLASSCATPCSRPPGPPRPATSCADRVRPRPRPLALARARRGRGAARIGNAGRRRRIRDRRVGVSQRSTRRTGPELSCKGWQQEAALRMLMNNLDPEVAERPEDLVVYGGSGRAARSWEASTRSCAN